jgi:hypothetical protein
VNLWLLWANVLIYYYKYGIRSSKTTCNKLKLRLFPIAFADTNFLATWSSILVYYCLSIWYDDNCIPRCYVQSIDYFELSYLRCRNHILLTRWNRIIVYSSFVDKHLPLTKVILKIIGVKGIIPRVKPNKWYSHRHCVCISNDLFSLDNIYCISYGFKYARHK